MFTTPEESFVIEWARDSVGKPCTPQSVRRWDYLDWHYTESVPSFPYKNSIASARYMLVECDGSEVNGPYLYPSYSIRHWMCADGEWREPLIYTDSEVCTVQDDVPELAPNLGPPDCEHQCFGDPINSALGNKYESRTEYEAGSRFLRLDWTYNARAVSGSSIAGNILGRGRSTNLSPSISHFTRLLVSIGRGAARAAPTETTVYLTRPNGKILRFRDVGDDWEAALPDGGRLFRHGEEVWEYQSKDGVSEFFGARGRLERIQDLQGQFVELDYDDRGRVILMTDAQGRSLGFIYNEKDHLASLLLPEGGVTTFSYTSTGYLERVTYPDGTGITYLYDEPDYSASSKIGLLTGEIDEKGVRRSTTWYDGNGFAYKTALAGGTDTQSAQYTASNNGKYKRRTVVTSGLGSTRTTDFIVRRGKLVTAANEESCVGCTPVVSTYLYNDAALVSSISRNGIVENREYDAAGNERLRVENAAGTGSDKRRIETLWAADRSRRLSETVYGHDGALIRARGWTYNARGQVLSESVSDGFGSKRTSTFTYCEAGDVSNVALGCPSVGLLRLIDGPRTDVEDVTRIAYYRADDTGCDTGGACAFRAGDIARTTNAMGHSVDVLAYSAAGRPSVVKDANGVVSNYTYNARGWVTSLAVLVGSAGSIGDHATVVDYWPGGQVKRITAPDGDWIAYAYDEADRLISIEDNTGNRIHYSLDAVGNRIGEQVVGDDGAVKLLRSRIFNAMGQLVNIVDAASNRTAFTYDANGDQASVTDALGRRTLQEYDGLKRLKRVIQDAGGIAAVSRFSYDALDNLSMVTDPKGLDTTYRHNGLGDLSGMMSPDTGETVFSVDAAGNRTLRTDARGVTAHYQYDALNRLSSVSYPDSSQSVHYTYDVAPDACEADERFAKGRLARVMHAGGGTEYCFDHLGQVTRKVQAVNGVSSTLRYAYTQGGHLARITYPDGSVVDYVRNAMGRIAEIGLMRPGQGREVVVTSVIYAPFGPPIRWAYGNGRTLERPIDQNYRPLAVHDGQPDGLSLGFEYDSVGSLVKLKNGDGVETLASYGYDALGRLTQTRDGATSTPIETYAYDATGNRLSLTTSAGIQLYQYPATSHRLIGVNGEARHLDAAGNTLTIGSRAFAYNDANRMNEVKQSGAVVETYLYNHRGERIQRSPAGGEPQFTVYDEAGQWLGNYNSIGQSLQQAIWLDNYPVALINAPAVGVPEVAFIQPDHLGTPRVVIDPVRNLSVWEWSSKSEVFGNQAPSGDPDGDGVAFELALRFPGQQATDASGLFYNYQREYDPAVGRYSQSDPIGLRGGGSIYAYVRGNPVSLVDPLGLADRYVFDGSTLTGYNRYAPPPFDSALVGSGLPQWTPEISVPAVSGPWGDGKLPAGTYGGRNLRKRSDKAMTCPGGNGYSLDLDDKGGRSLLRIHPDGNVPGTLGCVGIVCGYQNQVFDSLQDGLQRNGGEITLEVDYGP